MKTVLECLNHLYNNYFIILFYLPCRMSDIGALSQAPTGEEDIDGCHVHVYDPGLRPWRTGTGYLLASTARRDNHRHERKVNIRFGIIVIVLWVLLLRLSGVRLPHVWQMCLDIRYSARGVVWTRNTCMPNIDDSPNSWRHYFVCRRI